MSVAGLIVIDASEGIAASQPIVAGQPLIELQARIARAAGVTHLIVLLSAMPPGLVASLDRLRDEGVAIDLARTAGDAADRVHPDERLVVMSGGTLLPREALATAIAEAPVIAAVPEAPETAGLERIDATQRWTGFAVVDGALLRSTAKMLGDWTLAPTLLRTALQAKVATRHIPEVMIVAGEAEARSASQRLMAADGQHVGAFSSLAAGPLVSAIAPALFARRLPAGGAALAALTLLTGSIGAALAGWPMLGLGLILLATVPNRVAERLASVSGPSGRLSALYPAGALAAFAACALTLAAGRFETTGQWGGLVLAGWLVIALLLQPRDATRAWWHADAETSALVLLVAALAGQPLWGLALALALGVVTQFLMVRRLR